MTVCVALNASGAAARAAVSEAPCARPVRVCFPFAGGLVGGSHVSALRLIQLLDRARFDPIVLLHAPEGPLGELLRSEGVEVEPAPVAAYLAPGMRGRPSVRDVWRMTRFLRRRGVAIVHTNEGAMHVTWTLPARLAGARHIWHHRGNPRAAALRLVAPLTATRVISVSNFAAPAPGAYSAHRKCAVVYSPFDTDAAAVDWRAARADARATLGVGEETRILAFLGQYSQRKRPLIFVDAVAALVRRRPDLKLLGLMFGDDYEPGLLQHVERRIHALGVADQVRLMGFRRPIEPWLAAADALVVPAVEEPFGRTLIEAMLIGVPVVAAATGGNIEAIEHRRTGLLARPDDAEDFAETIAGLFADPVLAAAIVARARAAALRRFGAERHARVVADIYSEALAA